MYTTGASAWRLDLVAGFLDFLEGMPRAERENDTEISLHRRRRKLDHGVEFSRCWTIGIEGQVLKATSAGPYFNPATGGDSCEKAD